MTTEIVKGTAVRFAIKTRTGITRGKGTVTKGPPKKPMPGTNRVTVRTDDGRELRPYVSQCKALA